MKKLLLIVTALFTFAEVGWGQIISQYIETNSGTTPKGIEIWNNTTGTLDFSSNNLVIKKGVNGGAPATDYTLSSGTLAPGDVIVIGTSDMQTTAEGNGSTFYLKAFSFNGDDALEVWYGSTKTDIFGEPGNDPGSSWDGGGVSTRNQNIKIKAGVTAGASAAWTDPSTRFETVNTNPSGTNGDEGFGVAPVYVWTGSTSTNWGTTSNWDGNYVPVDVMNVSIPGSLSNYPSIDGSPTTPSECNNLTIASGATLTIPAGQALTVHGDLTNNAGTSGLTIECSASVIGSLIVEGDVTGNSTSQRYILAWNNAAHGWHLLSSPVTAQEISTEFVDITATPISSDVDFYRWSEADDLWINIKDGSGNYNQGTASTNFSNDASPLFSTHKGYLVAYSSDVTKNFTGIFNSYDVSMGNLNNTPGNTYSGWNLIGNPFPSAVYWNKTDWSLVNIDATAKVWDESSAAYSDVITGDIIPANQGFMIHVTSSASSGSLIVDAADRVHNLTGWYKNETVDDNTLKLTVSENENSTAQESIIRINENATKEFDPQFDSRFLKGFAPQFYSVLEDCTGVSTNALPNVSASTTIPFAFVKNSATEYTLTVDGIESFTTNEKVYLIDLKTNYTQNLNENPVYHFSAQEGDAVNRFNLYFGVLGVDENTISDTYSVFNSGNQIKIQAEKAVNANVFVYNVAGQLIAKTNMNHQSFTSIDMNNFKGMAVVSIVSNGSVRNHKVIVY